MGAELRRGRGPRRRHPADGVRRRRAGGRADRAAAPRRAVVVVPLPARDRGAHQPRDPVRGARPDRVRSLRQAARHRGLLVRPPGRVDARARPRPPRPARRDAGRAGLGRADRPAAGRRAPGPLRPRGRGQHRAPDRRLRHAGDLVAVPACGGERRDPRRGPPRRGRLRAADGRRRAGGVRRAVPRAARHGGRTRPADPRADAPRRPGHGGQPRCVGGAVGQRAAVPRRLQRQRPDHGGDGARSCASSSPARAGSTTRPSPAPVTSSRRTPAPSSAAWSPASCWAERAAQAS